MNCTCTIGKPMCSDCMSFWREYMDIVPETVELTDIEQEEC